MSGNRPAQGAVGLLAPSVCRKNPPNRVLLAKMALMQNFMFLVALVALGVSTPARAAPPHHTIEFVHDVDVQRVGINPFNANEVTAAAIGERLDAMHARHFGRTVEVSGTVHLGVDTATGFVRAATLERYVFVKQPAQTFVSAALAHASRNGLTLAQKCAIFLLELRLPSPVLTY